ncbi:hypothetical protein [Sodalis sp. RH18]|uniref:hypothetical protein n=1 Tax=Sodalis sp. RH18 TaxID=3394333 RepID=UPI0039B62E65
MFYPFQMIEGQVSSAARPARGTPGAAGHAAQTTYDNSAPGPPAQGKARRRST